MLAQSSGLRDSTVSVTSVERSKMVSTCGLRFWMVTTTRFVTIGRRELRVTTRGALIFVTAKSCASGIVSSTKTVKKQVLVLPARSLAVQFTVVAPSANVDPEGGSQTT